jgi:putative ABC transport system permease protein
MPPRTSLPLRFYKCDESAHDPLVFAAVAAVLILAATAASAIPAFRAARVDPSVALRTE